MNAQLSFSTARFKAEEEPENPFNEFRGHAVLSWLAERLTALGLISHAEVLPEDWGWCLTVEVFAERYMFVCSAEVGDLEIRASDGQDGDFQEWTLGLLPQRSLLDRLLGRREFSADNALLRIVIELFERQSDFSGVELVME